MISPITPVNQMTHTFTQNYRLEHTHFPCPENCYESGVNFETNEYDRHPLAKLEDYLNVPSKFEGGPLEAIESTLGSEGATSEWSPAGQEITNINTVEGNAEIKG